MRVADLIRRLNDEPFKAFRTRLSDGTTLDVRSNGMGIVGQSSAVLPTRFGRDEEGTRVAQDWRTIALRHIVQFSDLNGRVDRKKPRRF